MPVVDVGEVRERPGGAGLTALLCRADDLEVTLVAPLAADEDGRAADRPAHPGRRPPGPAGLRRQHAAQDAGAVRGPVPAAPGRRRTRAPRTAACPGVAARRHRGGGRRPRLRLRRRHHRLPRAARGARAGVGAPAGRVGPAPARRHTRGRLRPRHPQPGRGPRRLRRTRSADAGRPVAAALVRRWAARAVAVTAGEQGAWLSTSADEPSFVAAPAVSATDPCGAGDRFSATAAQALARGSVPSEAVAAAVAEASAWVAAGAPRPSALAPVPPGRPAHVGAACPEPRRPRRDGWATGRPSSWPPPCAGDGGTLVATGGCFDVLHAGHVASLEAARTAGRRAWSCC